jgi:transcriptional regulator with XRE-family HTH domain
MDDGERITRQRMSEQVRSARSEKGYSLTDLARASGLSVSTIHKIENCAMTPTVMTLLRIVKAVGKDIDFFVGEPDDHKDYVVIRYREAICSVFAPEKSLIRGLSAKFPNCRLEVHHSRIRRGGHSGKKVLIHNSEEVSICWKGMMKFIIGKETTVLEPLDSIHIKSGVRHRWENAWNGESEVLFVYSPPLLT